MTKIFNRFLCSMVVVLSFGLLAGWICENGVATRTCLAQEAEKEKPKSAFDVLQASFVTLRFNGTDIVYSARVFVADKGATPKPVIKNVEQTYTVAVPFSEDVDGKKVNRFRTETRTRTVQVKVMSGGKYKVSDVAIEKDSKFISLEGKPIDRKKMIGKIGMQELRVLLLPAKMKVPKIWKQVLKPDTIILKYNQPLKGQNSNAIRYIR